MSTHLRTPNRSPNDPRPTDPGPNDDLATPSEDLEEGKKKVLDLSLTQIVGGALAAMTAAALGSTLGVGGTIVGAALASIVAGVGGSLYTASLRTGRERVRTVFRAPAPTDATSAPPVPVESATTIVSGRTDGGRTDETQLLPVWDDPEPTPPRSKGHGSKPRAFPWKRAVAVSLAVFALAAVLITGYERVSGQPLSGGSGTTVSQVRNDNSGSGSQDTEPSQTPSASASSTPSSSASESPAPSASDSGSPSASASDSPTPSASESTPESSPSASGAAAGDQGTTGDTGAATGQ